jgi:hypothetical protein
MNTFFEIMSYEVWKETEFKYLGTLITSNNNMSSEIHHRLLMANRCYYELKNKLRSHYISIKIKCKLCKTLIKCVLFYGCETWAMGKNDESKISIFERKVLGKYMDQFMTKENGELDTTMSCINF